MVQVESLEVARLLFGSCYFPHAEVSWKVVVGYY